MILESTDRFTVVQGYAGVGKTTQFRAVMSAISLLPEETRPRVIGLAPTHRAVGEMQSDGPGCGHCAAEGRAAYPGRTGHSPGHPAA
ncbi:AAA family ATPase [Klebsiella pneumoniae]|nr:AAA family ATPase [Klebsiella pneumoniae]UZK98205.1 AAA family ATPase [Klebsiella pneumoniae]